MQSPLCWGQMCCSGVPESGKTLLCPPYASTASVGGRQWQGEPWGHRAPKPPRAGGRCLLGVREAVLVLTSAFLWCVSRCPRGLLPSPLS